MRRDLHTTLIVYEDASGNSTVLFRGDRRLAFSGPQVVDEDRIAFVALRDGVRQLMLFNYATGELFRVETENGDDGYWRYMRGLNVSEGRLLFSHNNDDRMFKLSSIDLETMQGVFSRRDFSGGVSLPVSVNGTIYYRGTFFFGDRLMRFPEQADSLSGAEVAIVLTPVNRDNYGWNLPFTANPEWQEGSMWQGPTRPYFVLPHMNPFRLWVPLPLIRTSINDSGHPEISVDGAGIFSLMGDPLHRHFIHTFMYGDFANNMLIVDPFTWQNTVAGFPLTLEFVDRLLEDNNNGMFRNTIIGLTGSFSQSWGRWLYGFSLGGGYARNARDDGGASAYHWQETEHFFFYSVGLSLSNTIRRRNDIFGTGVSLNLRLLDAFGYHVYRPFQPRIEGMFRASAETRFPVSLTLYGAFEERGMNLHGDSSIFAQTLFSQVASIEYAHPSGLNLTWLAGAELSLGLFSIEIQRNLSHAYFNRFFGTLAVRSVFFDGQNLPHAQGVVLHDDLRLAQSLVLRLGLLTSFLPISAMPIFVEPHFWGAWKFSNTINEQGQQFSFGFGINWSR